MVAWRERKGGGARLHVLIDIESVGLLGEIVASHHPLYPFSIIFISRPSASIPINPTPLRTNHRISLSSARPFPLTLNNPYLSLASVTLTTLPASPRLNRSRSIPCRDLRSLRKSISSSIERLNRSSQLIAGLCALEGGHTRSHRYHRSDQGY